MSRWLVGLLLLVGCARIEDKPVLEVHSERTWRVVVSTRQVPLSVGPNAFVVAIQRPDRAWVPPGEVQLKMTMAPRRADPQAEPIPVNLQPDGQNGHFLAIVDLPEASLWDARLSISHKGVEHTVAFALPNTGVPLEAIPSGSPAAASPSGG